MAPPKQLAAHAFKPGWKGGPGRPKGSRTRLQEFALQLIDEDFREHGKDVLERVREKHPQIYLMGVLSLLPKQTQKIESPLADLTDEEIEMIEEMLAACVYEPVRMFEMCVAAAVGGGSIIGCCWVAALESLIRVFCLMEAWWASGAGLVGCWSGGLGRVR
jgi:hypothetical protein